MRGCTRWDLEPVEWDVDAKTIARVGAYAGRHEEPGLTEIGGYRCHPKYPPENPDEGCPGGWRLSRFVLSVAPYLRLREEGGGRVSNPLLDRCDDPLVHAAVNLFEREQERCHAHRLMLVAKSNDG